MKSWKLSIGCSALVGLLLAMSACRREGQSVGYQTKPVSLLQHSDDFDRGLDQWFVERENGGDVSARDGRLDIDVPAGCSVWFRPKLSGSVVIEYEATAIQAGGTNDRVSDLNCFWMAQDPKHPDDLFAHPRSGKFEDYNSLLTYYVGLGGNGNTTTRFRRYIGDATERPLLAEHDLRDSKFMLVPNIAQKIRISADGGNIQFSRDGVTLFSLHDAEPYREGWFGFRTTKSHLQIRGFRVHFTGDW